PLFQDRYRALLAAMLAAWREIGVEVSVVTKTMPEYLTYWNKPIDLLLARWIADYDDPDNFGFSLFHTEHGHWRSYFSSEERDRLFEEGRLERRPAAREAIYRRFENTLLDDAVLIPLLHELDYRLSGPGVVGLTLRSGAPFINFTELGKRAEAAAP